MQLIQLKSASEIRLPGVSVEFISEDKTLKEVILRTKDNPDGYTIRPGSSYSESVRVFRRQMHETKKVWRVSGTIFGMDVSKDHDDEAAANRHRIELTNQTGNPIKVEEVEIRVMDTSDPAPASGDGIPF